MFDALFAKLGHVNAQSMSALSLINGTLGEHNDIERKGQQVKLVELIHIQKSLFVSTSYAQDE